MASSKTVLIEAGGGVVVHQLLCGREIANKRKKKDLDGMTLRNWEFAETMRNIVYLVVDHREKEALVYDGAWDVQGIYDYAEKLGVKIIGAMYSHGHYDHVGGVIPKENTGGVQLIVSGIKEFVDRGVPAWVGENDVVSVCLSCQVAFSKVQIAETGETVQVGSKKCTIWTTPGHTAGSLCLYLPPGDGMQRIADLTGEKVSAPEGCILSGDTLFVGETGRTDLSESNEGDLMKSLSLLCKNLSEKCVVCPGHNYSSPSYTTLGYEKKKNRLVMAGMQRFSQPGQLPPACCSGCWRLASELIKEAAFTVRSLGGGELAFDGVPFNKATALDLKEQVIEQIKAFDGKGKGARNLPAASSLRLSDSSGSATLQDGDSIFDPMYVQNGLMIYGAELPKASARRSWFEVGTAVLIEGLKSAQELNGCQGQVLAWDYNKERYEVQIDGMPDRKSLKADNLKKLAAAPSSQKGGGKGKGKGAHLMSDLDDDMEFGKGKGKGKEKGKETGKALGMGAHMGSRPGGSSANTNYFLDVDDEIEEPPIKAPPVQKSATPQAVERERGSTAQRPAARPVEQGGKLEESECWRIVFENKVAVRAEPSTKAKVLGAKMPGSQVYVDYRQGDWVKLHPDMYPDSREAWMLVDGTSQGYGILLEQEIEEWRVVHRDKVVVRSEPDPTGRMMGSRQSGAILKVSYRKGDWVRLSSSEGFAKAAWMLVDGSAKGLGVLLRKVGEEDPVDEAPIDLDIPASTKPVAQAPPVERAAPVEQASRVHSAPAADLVEELSALQAEISELRMEKAEAVEDEDYDLAAEVSAKLKAAEARQKELQGAQKANASNPGARLRELRAELQQATEEKNQAVEDEDYDAAAEIKKRIKAIEGQIAEIEEVAQKAAREREQVLQEIEQVKAAKAQAVEDEDFKEASACKRREQELEAKLKELGGASA